MKLFSISVFFILSLVTSFCTSKLGWCAAGLSTRYDVLAKGFRVGTMTASQTITSEEGIPAMRFESRTDVNASCLWIRFSLASSERAVIRGDRLVSYSRREKNKDGELVVEGRLESYNFRFDVTHNGKKRVIVIPSSSYDRSAMECPEGVMEFGPDGTRTLRVLDPEYMEVVTRKYKLVGEEKYRVDGREYRCRIVDFTDPHKSCRRWTGKHGQLIIVFRQDGKSREGAYSVRAKEVTLH